MIAPRLLVPLAAFVTAAIAATAACGSHPPPPPAPPPSNTAPARVATPHTIADVGGVLAVALGGDDIYIRTDAWIGRVDRVGGEPDRIARTEQRGTELGVTPGFVWWVDDGHLMRADRGSRKVERVAVGASRVYQLATTGSDVWITAGGDPPAPWQLLVFESEATAARHVLDLGADPPLGLAAGDGVVALSGNWLAFSIVRDGALVDIDKGTAGSTLAVAGNRLVTGGGWIKMFSLDVGSAQIVSPMRLLGLETPGCTTIPGMRNDPYMVEGMTALAGGGGRFAIASAKTFVDPNNACRNLYIPVTPTDTTAKVSLIDASGHLEQVAAGEDPTYALAVDARGVVWATPTALRAADR